MLKVRSILTQAIYHFENILAVIIIIAVIGEGAVLVTEMYHDILNNEMATKFQTFLDHALLYIIGLEIALMLIKHDALLIIDIIIYTLARKIIIQNASIWEILIGVFAVLLLYGLKYFILRSNLSLHPSSRSSHAAKDERIAK